MPGLWWPTRSSSPLSLKGLCDYLGTYLVNYAGFGTITDLRNHLYETTMRRSSSFFHQNPTGTILSTLINDVDRVQVALSSVIGDFLQQFFTFLVGIVLVIELGGYLSWALLLFIPVVVTSSRKIGSEVRTRTRTGQDKLAEIQNILHETVTGNRIVKAFNTELWEILRFKNAAKRLFRANLRSVRIQSISSPLMDTIGAIAIALFLLIGRNEIQHGHMTMGLFGAFIILLFKLYDPVRKFALFLQQLPAGHGRFGVDLWLSSTSKDDVEERPHARTLTRFRQSIQFENVGFSYSTEEGEHQILHNVDLEVHAGEVLAMVGPSGAGKSTLVNLIPRFFDVTSGRILIDGHDLRDLTLASLRRQVAQVTQETILFNDTVQQQHRLWPAGREGRGGGAGGAQRAGARLHPEHAAGLRHGDRRKGIPALRRRAAAHRHCPRHPQKRADSDSGRGHFGARCRERIAGAGCAGQPDAGPHRGGDRASAFHHPPRQPHRRARVRTHHGHRLPRGVAHHFAHLSEALPIAVHRHARDAGRQRESRSAMYLPFDDRAALATGATGVSMAIYSMTGFARVQVRVPLGDEDQLSYTLTVKSVNHRFLDLQFRLPAGLDALEMELRRVLKENLVRGHVDLTLSVDRSSQAKAGYNRELVAGYLAAFDAARVNTG